MRASFITPTVEHNTIFNLEQNSKPLFLELGSMKECSLSVCLSVFLPISLLFSLFIGPMSTLGQHCKLSF